MCIDFFPCCLIVKGAVKSGDPDLGVKQSAAVSYWNSLKQNSNLHCQKDKKQNCLSVHFARHNIFLSTRKMSNTLNGWLAEQRDRNPIPIYSISSLCMVKLLADSWFMWMKSGHLIVWFLGTCFSKVKSWFCRGHFKDLSVFTEMNRVCTICNLSFGYSIFTSKTCS